MVGARFGPWNLILNHHGRRFGNGNRERLDEKGQPAFSGIIVDGGGTRWLDGSALESAKLGRHLVAIHVCEESEYDPKFRKGFPVMKSNELVGSDSGETLAKRLAKQRSMAVVLEFDPTGPRGNWVALAKWFANQLPATSIVLAVHKGKTIFKRQSTADQFRGFQLQLRPEFYFNEVVYAKEVKGDSDELLAVVASDDRDEETDSRSGNVKGQNTKALLSSISVVRRQLPESNLGWPLRRRSCQGGHEVIRKRARNVSVVQWVMSLPNRTGAAALPKDQNEWMEETSPLMLRNVGDDSNEVEHNERMPLSVSLFVNELQQETPGWPLRPAALSERSDSSQEAESETSMSNQTTDTIDTNLESQISYVPKQLKLPITTNRSACKCFSYAELRTATSDFSAENLIGEGGYSSVYKGCLLNGTSVVVKVLKSNNDARDNFLMELDVVSSIKHEHIAPLIGVCMENEHLISVYDYFPEGSLDENLHGQKGRGKFQWEMRFKVAIAVAEALNYLHNECSSPVIHRDIKSSNILVSEKFQPQLSDFGLAMRGPTDSSYVVNTDVVGTFGYIAPEYLMHGKVSDKIDVYAFGVVLLELLSGRRPIDRFGVGEGQGSLVLWAKEVLNSEDPKVLMDPEVDVEFNDDEVQRVIMAAKLCIDLSARLRPNVSEILKVLKGEARVDDGSSKELNHHDVDDIFPKFMTKPSLSFALRDIDYDGTSSTNAQTTTSNIIPRRRQKLKEYLKEPHEI
ncbi:proline-rich receptor-like protein kinase PERK2 [Cucurbita pepo subsp. pepo]|uniref:proline-rich receptor-like protein kinase PERK2 n=1 Tax=Cucurbita pepo subsp. pepo TaxID=3664 RepID=UPI000C9D7EF8|nr:proline-rich receptor-like protein kinase PERK2 [Cucurbita pepo subsp. pepo]